MKYKNNKQRGHEYRMLLLLLRVIAVIILDEKWDGRGM